MSDVVASSDVAPVTDRRPVPRGVLPRGMQTWLMVALAMGMLAVILLTVAEMLHSFVRCEGCRDSN